MSYNYDVEAGMTNLPPAIQNTEEAIATVIPRLKNVITEAAKKSNVPQLIKNAEDACNALDGVAKLFSNQLGVEGESAGEGTLYGLLNACKKIAEATGGM